MSTVTIVGLGNIGSALVMLVARMRGILRLTLVDPDVCVESNVVNQAIDAAAVGRPKVEVQAAAIRAINPQIRVEAIKARVENVPLARLDSSVLVSCVDNRTARQAINRIAWRCGKPWIDAAVDAPSLVRVNVYVPGESAPCLECSFDDRTYELLEQEYPCDAGNIQVPATGAPAELGTLAAAFQACEIRKIVEGDVAADVSLVSAQLMLDTQTYARHLCRFERNEQCRFDHESWQVEAFAQPSQETTLAEMFDAVDGGSDPAISLEGQPFVVYVDCIACGRRAHVGLSLYGRLSDSDRTCDCGGRMFAPGFFSSASIRRSELSRPHLGLRLTDLGIRSGDVVSVTDESGGARHIEIKEGQPPNE